MEYLVVENFTAGRLNMSDFDMNQSEIATLKPTSQLSAQMVQFVAKERVIFLSSVVIVGLVGCCANGVVLGAFLSSTKGSKAVNKLMLNQIVLDLMASFFLAITYASKINDLYYVYPSNLWGDFLCKILVSALLPFWGLFGSITSLVLITLDRYFKVVYPLMHRKHFKDWMVNVGIAISWIIGILLEMAGIWTGGISNGKCFKFYFWPTNSDRTAFNVMSIVLQYFVPLVLFIFCYGHILIALRKAGGKVSNAQTTSNIAGVVNKVTSVSNKSEANILKTMITISVFFIVCCSPNQFLYILISFKATSVQTSDPIYFFTVFLIFCNVVVNPFIYAVKHDAVKHQLAVWLGSKSASNLAQASSIGSTTRG